MKYLFSYILAFVASVVAVASLSSCEDRLDYPDDTILDGVSNVEVEVAFKPFDSALESRASGTAMKYIKTLWMVIYDRSGNFIEKRQITDFNVNVTEPRPGSESEAQTGCAKFNTTIHNGYYKIYVVANHNLSAIDDSEIDEISKLKALDLEWKSGDVTQNAQMFGWLINGTRDDDHGTDAPVVAIRNSKAALHAWVRRAASKVTIAFDTNNLNEYVNIYLKSVTIKDVPTHCYLADENSPGDQGYSLSSKLTDGETIYFKGAKAEHVAKDDYSKWPCLHSSDSVFGLYSDVHGRGKATSIRELINREHADDAPALYFYENMQGTGIEHTESDKRQDVSGQNKQVTYPTGVNSGDKAWKDGKPFGTYIEVKGYYENMGSTAPGRGEITYRFMLGKDHVIDYNAERNNHYKLTMTFNGNANDIDFHIDYKEEAYPGFFVQDTTYVSYLYNQTSHTIVRATPRKGYDFVGLESYILDNEWRPHGGDEDYNEEAWTWQTSLMNNYARNIGGYNRPDYVAEWTDRNGAVHKDASAKNTEFGFLSLRYDSQQIYEFNGRNDKPGLVKNMRKLYFHNDRLVADNIDGNKSKDNSLGYRNYGTIPQTDGTHVMGTEKDGTFDISRKYNPITGNTDYIMEIPLYTRAMSLDSWAVYSGANPFYTHYRYARVRLIATYKKVDSSVSGPATYQESDETVVLQSRRIINPRVIYRRKDNRDPFLVTLCYNTRTSRQQLESDLDSDVDTTTVVYEPIYSNGPWSATIEKDPYGFVSISANGRTITREGQFITGRNNTPVQFTYKPTKNGPDDGAYGAIITIYYHGNNCSHKIVVRQGYGAADLGKDTDAKWSAFNVYDENNLTVNPLSVGSIFRRYSDMKQPIAESNNLDYVVHQVPSSSATFKIVGSNTKKKWSEINAHTNGGGTVFGAMNFKNVETGKTESYRLPDKKELPDIGIYTDKTQVPQTNQDEIKRVEDIGNGYGIAYADGATKTLFTEEATAFYDPDNNIRDSKRGVRGVVVYSVSSGNNVFFPFGRWGHPRRRASGELQYGSVDFILKGGNNNYRPMAYALL
ncbi:MAG: hypothetical protein K2L14_02755 [Duncaniella sp.]|nr:hypothetical protein [Duncaniella sp.]